MPDIVRLEFAGPDNAQRGDKPLRLLAADITGQQLGNVEFGYAPPPEDNKGADGIIEWVSVGLAAGYLLRDLLRLAMDWSRRERRPVVVHIDGDSLMLGDATDEQQRELVDAFLARHGAD
ncbi:effector-associated constant component EACC1 [Rhizocola hellebori]|uniref:effector-associated constant component EACC1 n=1 Tax=Rhizocola hellebori TaxID=1392758 RepID=UPI001943CEDF|nr:hypothetical protein [Rhizocola hellebori]